MKRLAVIGNPISHSLSPLIFNQIGEKFDIDSHYTRVSGNSYYDILNLLKNININAFNITSPYKNLAFLTACSFYGNTQNTEVANFISVNNQELRAYNTDLFAISEIIKKIIKSSDSQILILGGGNTAITSLVALKRLNFNNITVALRSFGSNENNHLLKDVNKIELSSIKSFKNIDILINTIPQNNDIRSERIDNPELTIIDTIYHNPYLSNSNCKYIDGLHWLAYQAIPAIELCLGIKTNFRDIYELLSSQIIEKKGIVLSGFMASGKTTLGKKLAEKLNFNFVDSDELIENQTGLKISEIFNLYGDEHFRKIEKETILSIKPDSELILSIGGGALFSKEIAEYINKNFYNIYIYSDIEDIKKRVIDDNVERPLADLDYLAVLFSKREEIYFRNSDLIVYNNSTIKDIISLLFNEIRNIIKY